MTPAPVQPAPAAPMASASRARLVLVLAPMPVGTLKAEAMGFSVSEDTAFAFGIAPFFDYSINEYFFAGAAPQLILNVKPKDGTGDAGKQLDLRVRAGGNAKVADTVQLFGYLAPGYSIIMVPNKPSGVNNPAGLVLGFAGGALIDLTPAVFASAEVGYQLGFQSVTFMGLDTDFKSNYLHFGVGIGVRL